MSAIDQPVVGFQASSAVSGSSGTANMTTSGAVTAGAVIVVITGSFVSGGGQGLAVSGSGLTWTEAHAVQSGNLRAELWYAPAPSGLSAGSTITTTLTGGTAGDVTFAASSWTGLDVSGGVISFNGAGATNTAWSSGNVTGAGALIGGAWADGTLSTSTPTSPAVERLDQNSATTSESITIVDKLGVTGTNALAGTWSNSISHIAIAALFTESGASTVPGDPWVGHAELGPGYGPNPFQEIVTAVTTAAPQTFNQALTATATTTSSFVNQVGKLLTANVTSTATLAALKVILTTLTATVTTTATIVKQVGKLLTATLSAATAQIVKQVNKLLTATVTSTATLAAIKVILRTLTATVTTTASFANRVGKALAATVTSTASLVKQVNKALSATATSTATLNAIKVILRTLTASTVTTTATITRRTGLTLTATATTAASIAKRVGKTLLGAVSSVANLVAQFFGPPTQDLYPTPFEYVEQKSSVSYTEPFMFAHSDLDATRYQEQTGLTYREPKKLMGN